MAAERPALGAVGAGLDPIAGLPIQRDREGRGITPLEPGAFMELEQGQEVDFNRPPEAQGYADFMRAQLRAAAVAADVPYEVLTGDLGGINDRAARVILNEFRRRIEQRQHQVIAFQLCRPVWQSWFTQAVIVGALRLPDMDAYLRNPGPWERVEWVPPLEPPEEERQQSLRRIPLGPPPNLRKLTPR